MVSEFVIDYKAVIERVLILVLVEDGLRDDVTAETDIYQVLILVLVEDGLRV